MITMIIIIEFYNLGQLLIAWLPIIPTVIAFHAFCIDLIILTVIVTLIVYDLNLNINSINKTIIGLSEKTNAKTIQIYRTVSIYISNHNRLCLRVVKISNFFEFVNLMLFLAGLPLSLIVLHQLLFEKIDFLILKILYIQGLIVLYSLIFCIQYLLASFSSKMHKTYKHLSYFQWNFNKSHLGFKVRLLAYFERLSCRRRRIGISIGPLAVMTFPLFAGVSNPFFLNGFISQWYFIIFRL